MEGIGKRYAFMMRVLGKMSIFFDGRADQHEYFLTRDSKTKEMFSHGREQDLRYIFLAKER